FLSGRHFHLGRHHDLSAFCPASRLGSALARRRFLVHPGLRGALSLLGTERFMAPMVAAIAGPCPRLWLRDRTDLGVGPRPRLRQSFYLFSVLTGERKEPQITQISKM